MEKTLLIGYGNLDRQDDGVAWHILMALLKRFDYSLPSHPDDEIFEIESNPAFMFLLQLTPELAEDIAGYERVCFIDAHTSAIPEELHVAEVSPIFQNSPFTHHITPQTCISLASTLYDVTPEALLVSIRGYEFDFSRQLSQQTQALVSQAVQTIWEWATR